MASPQNQDELSGQTDEMSPGQLGDFEASLVVVVEHWRSWAGLMTGVPHHSWRELGLRCTEASVEYLHGRRSVAGTDASRARSAEDGRHGSPPREPADQLMNE